MTERWFPCRNPRCEEGMIRDEHPDSCGCNWTICPDCNGQEGDWREVGDYDE